MSEESIAASRLENNDSAMHQNHTTKIQPCTTPLSLQGLKRGEPTGALRLRGAIQIYPKGEEWRAAAPSSKQQKRCRIEELHYCTYASDVGLCCNFYTLVLQALVQPFGDAKNVQTTMQCHPRTAPFASSVRLRFKLAATGTTILAESALAATVLRHICGLGRGRDLARLRLR